MRSDDPNQLVELSYVSKATQDMGLSSLVHLFDVAHKWNQGHELTGALFYENGHFAQILEGRRKDVLFIWEKIPKVRLFRKVFLLEKPIMHIVD